MKKALSLLAIISLVSCVNSTKNDTSNTDSNVEEKVIKEIVEDSPSANAEKTVVTLDFSSYHLYTCEEDKYDASGYQPVSAKVTIDEENNKASLKLYDSGKDDWFTFDFRLTEKQHLQEGVVLYIVYNNVNQKGYLYVSANRSDGLFIDINNFVYGGNTICCWMQEGGSSGNQYSESVSIQSTPNTYSTPDDSYTPVISSGTLHSHESIYGNYSYYEETSDCVEGVVAYEGDDDFYIVETRKGYTVLEVYSGILYEGDKVRGELNKYGFKYLINRNRDSEVKVHIEDYMLSDSNALEWLGKNDHLNDKDQRVYDFKNDR